MKTLLFKYLLKYYSDKMAYACLNGSRKPTYEVMLKLYEEHKIPFTAWKDIKSFISNNHNINKDSDITRVQG